MKRLVGVLILCGACCGVEGLRPWRAQEAPQSSALRLCRPPLRYALSTPLPLRSKGGEPHLLHLPPLLAWARAKACL